MQEIELSVDIYDRERTKNVPICAYIGIPPAVGDGFSTRKWVGGKLIYNYYTVISRDWRYSLYRDYSKMTVIVTVEPKNVSSMTIEKT